MGRLSILKKTKGNVTKLTRVRLSGVVVPWRKNLVPSGEYDYKLVCTSGLEYFVVANSHWRNILTSFSWEEVCVVGLLNTSNMTIIPQKVFPKGPKGEKENVIDLALWNSKRLAKKIVDRVNSLILIPAAVV